MNAKNPEDDLNVSTGEEALQQENSREIDVLKEVAKTFSENLMSAVVTISSKEKNFTEASNATVVPCALSEAIFTKKPTCKTMICASSVTPM